MNRNRFLTSAIGSLAVVIGFSVSAANAAYLKRDCSYHIYAKSRAIGSIKLTARPVKFRGASHTYKRARRLAAKAALSCLKGRSSGSGYTCRRNANPRYNTAASIYFPYTARTRDGSQLASLGWDALCAVGKTRANSWAYTQIFAKTISGSRDVRRECALSGRNVYTVLFRKRQLNCSGRSSPRGEIGWKRN